MSAVTRSQVIGLGRGGWEAERLFFWQGGQTGSMHLNSPQKTRPSVEVTRRYLFSSEDK